FPTGCLLQRAQAPQTLRSKCGTSISEEVLAALARIRSLLIMIDEDRASRRLRETENSPSFRYPDSPPACIALIAIAMAVSAAVTLSRFMVFWKSIASSRSALLPA